MALIRLISSKLGDMKDVMKVRQVRWKGYLVSDVSDLLEDLERT